MGLLCTSSIEQMLEFWNYDFYCFVHQTFSLAFLSSVYKKAEAISREYSSTKGPGTTARPWEHPFFLKLGPIIRKKLEKATHENGFM